MSSYKEPESGSCKDGSRTPTVVADGIVSGTSGNDIIDTSYTGDPDGDRIDNNDAILAGEAPNDDIVMAGAGDDTVYAGLGDDDVYGEEGNDLLYGEAGDDLLVGGAGNDELHGGIGNDTLDGGSGRDTLNGGAGDDTIAGGSGNDIIDGGDGADTIDGGYGSDTINGGAGDDFIRGDGSDYCADDEDMFDERVQDISNVVFYFDTNGDGEIDYSVKVDDFPSDSDSSWVSNDLDVFYESMRDFVVENDPNLTSTTTVVGVSIKGGEIGRSPTEFYRIDGNTNGPVPDEGPLMNTGSGNNNVLEYSDFYASYDPSTYCGTSPTNGSFDDVIDGGDGDDIILGECGNDTITGGAGADSLYGGDDRDLFIGGTDGDHVDGNEGGDDFDTLDLTGQGPIRVHYDPSNSENGSVDFLDATGAVTGSLTFTNIEAVLGDIVPELDGYVEGTDGDDLIDTTYTGDPEGDRVDANDEILPGEGPNDDIILAGAGNDTVYAGEGNDDVYAGTGNDSVYGEAGDDILYGEDGDDLLEGGAGDDRLFGGNGNDTLNGGDGNDYLDAGQDGDILNGDAGDDTLLGGAREDILNGGTGNDTLIAGNAADILDGGEGDDTLDGEFGNDTIYGGEGADTVYGGEGDDFIDTSSAYQRPDLDYPGLYPADTDPNDDRDIVYGGAGNDTIITGDDADYIDGGDGDDRIDAGVDADTILGGAGNDYIVGGEGSDTIDGGAGDDTIYGGLDPVYPDSLNIPDATDLRPDNGMDVIHGGDGNDTIYGQDDNDLIYGDAGNDTLYGGIDNDTIHGGADDDMVSGDDGDDTLYGDQGNDTLVGGEGADSSYGGDDRDTFIGGNAGDFVDGGEGGDDYDTLDLTGAGPLHVFYDGGNPENGTVEFRDGDGNVTGTMTFENIENVIPCFTPGTTIATPRGERLVEELQIGDKIITRDNGIQEIRWFGVKEMDWKSLAGNPHLRPILIQKGALGNGLPERDMLVSPNHRVLVANDKTTLYFEEREVLAAAKHLVNNRGIHEMDSMGTSYIHFMFDHHEVVLSNGSWTESFQPGDYSLKGLGNAQRTEIFELFPELQTADGIESYQAARKTLKKHEAQLLLR